MGPKINQLINLPIGSILIGDFFTRLFNKPPGGADIYS